MFQKTWRWVLVVAIFAFPSSSVTASATAADASSDRDQIVSVIEASYMRGAFNEQDTEAMRAGFHPVFKIHGVQQGEISTYPIAEWVSDIEKRKAKTGWKPQKWEWRFPVVDITGGAAMVKVELFRVDGAEKSHVFTDYLSLLRFDEGWKITDKVYHRH